jgi:hypothetical protein
VTVLSIPVCPIIEKDPVDTYNGSLPAGGVSLQVEGGVNT